MADSTIYNSTSQGALPPKLVGASNYSNWSTRLKVYLMGQDLWDVVAGRIQPQKTSGEQPTLTEDSLTTYITLKEFRRKGSASYGYSNWTSQQ